ncbi:hypothetical protein EJ05DRAFT_496568 [Pseudovirgaria hyperparasitica]|uniref:DUF7905 domain-containing protein n=1 Tax=Pseudovirgaria hyperparasitica TaxID=470096 RepID=A0A6A6WHT8_9PEZI|nr:uncharacterized protein EJ05DRAFT_496568 [Pseudovirgaria hyperparasitica]KAF2761665.1 hypothetical protein EJ05DRAFT_496568 [Pseudovirgaria hyperparasitica]
MPHPTGAPNRYFSQKPSPAIDTTATNSFALLVELQDSSSSSRSSSSNNLPPPVKHASLTTSGHGFDRPQHLLSSHSNSSTSRNTGVSSSVEHQNGPMRQSAAAVTSTPRVPTAEPSIRTQSHVGKSTALTSQSSNRARSGRPAYRQNADRASDRNRDMSKFTKTSAYNEKEEARKNHSEKKNLIDAMFTGSPPSNVPGLVYRDITYHPIVVEGARKKKLYTVEEVFGYNLAALNIIRRTCRVFINLLPPGNGPPKLRFTAQEDDNIQKALDQYYNKLHQARVSVNSRLPMMIWSGWEPLSLETVILKPRPDLCERERIAVINPNAVPTVAHIGMRCLDLDLEPLRKAIKSCLNDARTYHGVLRLRARLGTVILEQTPKGVIDKLPMNDFMDLCDDLDHDGVTFSPRLVHELDSKFPRNLFRANKFIEPKDHFTSSLSEVECKHRGMFYFDIGGDEYSYCLEIGFQGGLNPFRDVCQWVRLKTKNRPRSGAPKSFCLMDITLASPNEYGMCWNFELCVAQDIKSKDVPRQLHEFAEQVKMSHNTHPANSGLRYGTHPNLYHVQLIRKYEYRLRGSSYCVEASNITDIPQPTSATCDISTTRFKTIVVVHDIWDGLFHKNKKEFKATEGASFEIDDFFPDETFDGSDCSKSGLVGFLDKLANIESVVSERYWTE